MRRRGLPPLISLALHATLAGALLLAARATTADADPSTPTRTVDLAPPPLAPRLSAEPSTQTPRSSDADRPPAAQPAASRPTAPAQPVPTDRADAIRRAMTGREPAPAPRSDAPEREMAIAARETSDVSFAGLRAVAARDVVYVLDASGAMTSSFSLVRDRLRASLERLAPTQRFRIITLGDRRPDGPVLREFSSTPATDAARADASAWLDALRPAGRSNPGDGLRRALDSDPDLVFLLSRSIARSGPGAAWGRGTREILDELDALNPADSLGDRPAVIKTIQFLDDDPTGLMKTIASIHGDGGDSFRLLTLDQLSRPEPELPPTPRPESELERLTLANTTLEQSRRLGDTLRLLAGVGDDTARARATKHAQAALDALAPLPVGDDPGADLLAARALALLASAQRDPAAAGELASAAIARLDPLVLADPAIERERRLTLVAALVLASEPSEALAQLAEVPDLGYRGALLQLRASTAARRGVSEAILTLDTHTPDDPGAKILTAEAVTLAMLELGSDTHALDRLLALTADTSLASTLEQRRAIVYAAISRITGPHAARLDWASLPPEAALARALALGRRASARSESASLLELAAVPGSPVRPLALWERARVLLEMNTARALDDTRAHWRSLLLDHPDTPEAALATIALADDAALWRPGQTASLPDLDRALARTPSHPNADTWRLAAASAVAPAARAETLEGVDPHGRQGAAAVALAERTARELLDDSMPSPDALDRTLRLIPAPSEELLRRAVEVFAQAGRPVTAERWLARLRLDHADSPAEALRLVELRLDQGDTPGAFALARELARAHDPARTGSPPPPAFWGAWAVMLELATDQGDAVGAAARLERLRAIDPDLGPEPWRSRLRALPNPPDTTP